MLRTVGKAGYGTDVEGQRGTLGDGIEPFVGFIDIAREDDVHLAKARARGDGLDIIVDEIAVLAHHYGIQPNAFRDDRHPDVLAVHFVHPPLAPFVEAACDLVRIVLDGLLLGHTVHRVELLVGDIGAVRLESVQLRYIPAQEDLQRLHVHETGRVGDNPGQKPVVLLVSPQLGFPVSVAGDHDRFQTLHVPQHVHVRIKPELPLAVPHGGRNDDLECQVHLPVPLRNVAEPGRDPGRLQGFRRHHVTGGLVPDSLHEKQFPAIIVLDAEGVAEGFRFLHLRDVHVFPQDQGGGGIATLDGGEFPL